MVNLALKISQNICLSCILIAKAGYKLQKVAIKSDEFFRASTSRKSRRKEPVKPREDFFELPEDLVEVKLEPEEPPERPVVKIEHLELHVDNSDQFLSYETTDIQPEPLLREIKTECEEFEVTEEIFSEFVNSKPSEKRPKPAKAPTKLTNVLSKYFGPGSSSTAPRRLVFPFHPRVVKGTEFLGHHQALYDCNFCGNRFRSRATIVRHMQAHDPQIFPFGCGKCPKR